MTQRELLLSQYPLVLSHPHIRRIRDHKASTLILSRKLALGLIDINDALIEQRNQRAKKRGRMDLQENPLVWTVEIETHDPTPLLDINFVTIRAAGYQTTEDFYLDWLERRRRIDIDLQVYIHRFKHVETPQLLHRHVHRNYTTTPYLAARGEPEALSDGDLARLSRRGPDKNDERFRERAKRSIGLRAKQAAVSGDLTGFRALGAELALVISSGTALAGTVGTV